MATSEIEVTFPDDKESRFGTSFTVSSGPCGTQELVLIIRKQLHDLPVFDVHAWSSHAGLEVFVKKSHLRR